MPKINSVNPISQFNITGPLHGHKPCVIAMRPLCGDNDVGPKCVNAARRQLVTGEHGAAEKYPRSVQRTWNDDVTTRERSGDWQCAETTWSMWGQFSNAHIWGTSHLHDYRYFTVFVASAGVTWDQCVWYFHTTRQFADLFKVFWNIILRLLQVLSYLLSLSADTGSLATVVLLVFIHSKFYLNFL